MSLHNDINYLANIIEKTNDKEEKQNALYIKKIELLNELHTQILYIYNLGYNIESEGVKTELIEHLTEDKNNIIYNKRFTTAFLFDNYNKEMKAILQKAEKYNKMVQKEETERRKEQILLAKISDDQDFKEEKLKFEKQKFSYKIQQEKRKEEARRQEEIKKAMIQKRQQEEINRVLLLKSISQVLFGLAFILATPFILLIYFVIGITKATK